MDSIALVQSRLLIVPGNSLAEDIQIEVAVIELEVLLGIADLTDEVSSILKLCGCSEQKLVFITKYSSCSKKYGLRWNRHGQENPKDVFLL